MRIEDNSAGTAILTISTKGSGGLMAQGGPGIPGAPAGGAALAALVVLTWPVRRRRWMHCRAMRVLHMGVVGLFSLWLMGCGVQGQADADSGTTLGDYVVTVTGTAPGVSSTGQFTVRVR